MSEEALIFTVATVWREFRISCPHADILRAFTTNSLDEGAMGFIRFHLDTSQCPFCNAVIDDMRVADEEATQPQLEDLKDKLLRSTVTAIRDLKRK